MDILWTMIIFFAWVAWIWMLIVIFTDVFRRRDIGGWAKAGWVIFMIVLPFLGVLVYLIAQHDGMAQRQAEAMQQAQQQTDAYIRSVAGDGGGAADQIAKGKELLDSGAISQAEFDSLKARALGAA
jgi:energy-coupling factor transporter transmembrane protein EcfT